jgi:hypothetical protein
MRDIKEIKLRIIEAGYKAVDQLIKVAEEEVLKGGGVKINSKGEEEHSELAADRLKNAAATKKIAIFDSFEILNKIESERESLEMTDNGIDKVKTKQGFAERKSISSR